MFNFMVYWCVRPFTRFTGCYYDITTVLVYESYLTMAYTHLSVISSTCVCDNCVNFSFSYPCLWICSIVVNCLQCSFSNFSPLYLFISTFIIMFSVTCNTKSEMLSCRNKIMYLIFNLEKNASVSGLLCASRVRMRRCRNAVHRTIMFCYVAEMRHCSTSCIDVFALDNG